MPAFRGFSPGSMGPTSPLADFTITPEKNYVISGVTKDSAGAALGSCTVRLFNTATNILEQTTISDASGNYSFTVDKTQSYYSVSYKAGAPDVAGTTVNTLVGS